MSEQAVRAETASFPYDPLNRLTVAQYGPTYSESYAYDKAGNITRQTVSVTNTAPTDLTLNPASVAENQPAGTAVGTLTATDADVGDTFTFSLVPGAGDTNNASFAVDGNTLRTAAPLDREAYAGGWMTVCLHVTDQIGATYEEQVAIQVTNVNEPPTDIVLGWSSIAENSASGTNVGSLGSVDPEGGAFTYQLVSGTGGTDNGSFIIAGSILRTAAVFDYEAKNSYSILVRSTDSTGLPCEKVFTISVTDVNEAPIALNDTATTAEDTPVDIPVLANDSDPEGHQLMITWPPIACIQIIGFDCPIDYHPPANFCGTDTFTYTVSDGPNSTSATVTVTVTCAPDTPTNIALSAATVAEGTASGTVIGTLSTTDPDVGDTFTYTLVGGDTSAFSIVGSRLQTGAVFDYETKSSYSVTIRSTDQTGRWVEKAFTISVTNANEGPTDIALSNAAVEENRGAGTAVGDFTATDPDAGNTFMYSLVTGTGSTDNGSFTISGSTLRTAASFDFEGKGSYSIRVRVIDQGGLTFDKVFAIAVTNVNEAPTAIALAPASIAEGQPAGTAVGTLSTMDPDGPGTCSYALVPGTGGTDNGAFAIAGSQLLATAVFDFETKTSYSIRVRSTDPGLLSTEKVFTISVGDRNDPPTDLVLTGSMVSEHQAKGTIVGTLSSIDPDAGNSFAYVLAGGTGSTDNASFRIEGDVLKTNAIFNFKGKSSLSIRVRSTDQGLLSTEKTFAISVTDLPEMKNDFDGDGRTDIGCYYPPGGNWYGINSGDGFWQTQFGYAGTLPITGDFDADGKSDIGCYYPPGGNWYVMKSEEGFATFQFGYGGTIPIVGDFDGDGKDDIGCYYAPGGNWYLMKSKEGFATFQFGYAGTLPVVGDFDGDGKDDIGCYFPPGGNWYVMQSTAGFWQGQFGYAGTEPVVGDFDGDGKSDLGCYYPPGGNWYLLKSAAGFWQGQFGYGGTVPLGGTLR